MKAFCDESRRKSRRISEKIGKVNLETEEISSSVKIEVNEFYSKRKNNLKIGKTPSEIKVESKIDIEEKEKILSDEDEESSYEQMVQNNIADRMKFLRELNINDTKQSFIETLPAKEKKSKIKIQSYDSGCGEKANQVRRKSLRLQNVKPSSHVDVQPITYEEEIALPDPGPSELYSYSKQSDIEKIQKFVESLKSVTANSTNKSWPSNPDRLKRIFSSMVCDQNSVAKVVPQRIFSIKVHPSLNKNLVLVGAKYGELGIWDVNSGDENEHKIFYLNIHSKPINCMTVDKFNSTNIHTNSYDGSFRRVDLSSSIVQQYYQCNYRHYVSWHAQKDAHTFVVSGSDGFVDLIDVRSANNPESHFQLHNNRSVKLVCLNPFKEHEMSTGGSDGYACLWDLRKMGKKPISDLFHGRALSGLEYSASGNFLLSTSADDHMRIMSIEENDLKVICTIRHNNNTGRWVTTFKASWLPGSDSHFVVGSMDYPRVIEVWNAAGELIHKFEGENLQSVSSVNAFHPHKKFLAGGNSSGKVFLFRDESSF